MLREALRAPELNTGLVLVVVGLLMAAGLAGSVLPCLLGPPLIFAGAFVYAFATNWTPIGIGRLAILGALTVLAYVMSHVAAALGAKRFGEAGGRRSRTKLSPFP